MPVPAPRRFTRVDWYGWAGAAPFADQSMPFVCELATIETGLSGLVPANGADPDNANAQHCTIIGDGTGVGLHFCGLDGEQGPCFYKDMGDPEPEAVEAEMVAVIARLTAGLSPDGYASNY